MSNLEKISQERRKLSQLILGNARTMMIAFILFTVIVVMTTDITLVTISDIKDFGLEFFLILFSSYAFYVVNADGGTSAGLETDEYKGAVKSFSTLKDKISDNTYASRTNEFCAFYVAEELKRTRTQYLILVGIGYDEYLEKYAKLDKSEIQDIKELTKLQKKAIIKANKVKPIRFTSDMMLSMPGENTFSRFALNITPKLRKNLAFSAKFMKMAFAAVGMSLIALQVLLEPSWTVFAEVCMKLFTVIINGFDGRTMGYNNIVIDTVNFINTQSGFMQQAIHYIDSHPLTND